ncbi:hypothetical protein POF50_026710 [Streptomyces sp. SL13]|jgi:hypothetical protein|uniref:Uncharacterized protein n=1 Tax=Streptantibioticus silvisoli TaxID=2705255 RepID=A0AA90H3T0_9ACTN|nr:hypothetical protein [Streptantibioticus silvisoli]MDI5972894.1 hypothetical protein [Streptantibioticus silvisoli]
MAFPTAPERGRPEFPGGGGAFGAPAPGAPAPGGPPAEPARRRLGFGLLGPRRPRHTLGVEQLAAVGLPVGDDGVIIGVDAADRPAVLGLNRPTPLEMVLVGGLWLAQVLTLRAAATGTRVAVETGRPQAWSTLAQAAGGGQQCVTLHEVGRVPPLGPSVGAPVLVVRDAGGRPPRGRVSAAPWQSVLTVLPYLGPNTTRFLESASLVGVQRISPEESRLIGRIMAIPAAESQTLPTLADAFALWCTRTHRQLVMTRPTDSESGLLGAPRRMD